ncbi:outer membrane receptor protein involved in Fe transport [Polymorphobacter multimanifer]|uniref:Outer membrane receptor protein involved in Fe transport n=2 Tax=Polymorphobacter multimanifer TaxID=1070431 RepID=A0A841LFY8_9SPHN|nr:outer membrane receptor protein involved in Fe transport [Polymorphobacter multimanifer]
MMTSAAIAQAQAAAPATTADAEEPAADEILVVGSQIRGAKINTALPVTVIGVDEIRTTGAVSGDELFRSIPQFGDVRFNSQQLPGSSNAARGDVGSLDLRSLGVGNTLVLINGRRGVNHPTSQANLQLVPVLTFNSNTIPVNGISRMEVLRDGAAAIYGADAVAGVVNAVLKTNYEGAEFSVQYGGAEGTGFREFNFNGTVGTNFAQGRGNITFFGSYDRGTGLLSTDQDFTASSDKRPLFVGTRFEGQASLDGTSTVTPWASLQTPATFGTVRRNGAALTSASGQFHIQPASQDGCRVGLANGICIDDGLLTTAGADRNLRLDTDAQGTSILPTVDRINLFTTANFELTEDVTLFGEAGYFNSVSNAQQAPIGTLAALPITIPASNYWNPFGQAVFANGQVNPNRLSGTNVPAAGLPVTIRGYSFTDFGQQQVRVVVEQFRTLAGLRGQISGFDWETAVSYSEATATDTSSNISRTALTAALALSTPDAYNPFAGGSLSAPQTGNMTGNNAATIDSARQDLVRFTKSTLLTYDLRISRPDLIELPGGSVGFASGFEWRRETQLDDRDARIDGTIGFIDPVTGEAFGDLVNSALNPDTSGARNVASVYAELQVPLVSPEMNIPLIHRLDIQLAGRAERYSDFGNVAVPKVAGAWDIVEGVRLRGSWSKSFRAPNLEQTNATVVTRANARQDFIFCEADLRAGRITSFAGCARSQSTQARRAGNPDLDAERANTLSFGAVLEPPLPDGMGSLTFTADWWQVKQTGLVGIFGEGNALTLDYLLRLNGQTNPNVERAPVTADDIADFAGTGLTPAGQVLFVRDQYVNLQPQLVKGIDLALLYNTPETSIGRFSVSVNAAHLTTLFLNPSPGIQELIDAREAGAINAGVTIPGGGSLLRQNRTPQWRGSASLTWNLGGVTVGAFAQYVGVVDNLALTDANGVPWAVGPRTTANLYGQYRFSEGTLDGASVRIGVRNLTNAAPPIASGGFLPDVYGPQRRYWYVNLGYRF